MIWQRAHIYGRWIDIRTPFFTQIITHTHRRPLLSVISSHSNNTQNIFVIFFSVQCHTRVSYKHTFRHTAYEIFIKQNDFFLQKRTVCVCLFRIIYVCLVFLHISVCLYVCNHETNEGKPHTNTHTHINMNARRDFLWFSTMCVSAYCDVFLLKIFVNSCLFLSY